MVTRTARQHRIASLLEQYKVTNQAQLVALLEADGVHVTQTTASRDLEELGAVKVREPGGAIVYEIPELPAKRVVPEEHLARVMCDWVVDVAKSGNLVVLHTPPGSAHVVASAIDRAGMSEIIGTVAGDDTIMIVVSESSTAIKVARKMAQLASQIEKS